ncbi:hypothetical protein ACO1PF_00885 [Alkalibacterium sp. f15]|uniref:hypothetical protein n=1 Tax=Alkalibacterium sp. f15 TaxID=3414029 RepID=UPI003BF831BF
MGEQIEFPKNFNMYMTQVMSCLREGNVEKAIIQMKKAYAIKEEESLNILLVSSLLQMGQYQEALEMANEKSYFYESDEKRLLIYVEILIENNQFLQAEKHIKDSLSSSAIKYNDSWSRLQEKLDQSKRQQDENKRKAEEKTVKELYSLASLNTMEQFAKIEDIYTLPNEKLEEVAPHVFVNPYVHPLVRGTLFSLLAERGIDKKYSYLWFDETEEINPGDITAIEDNPTVNELTNILNDKLMQNPSLYQLVKNEIDTLFLMLYPFEEKVIKRDTAEDWVNSVIQTIEPDFLTQDKTDDIKRKNIDRWIKKIHSELLRFE